MFGSRVRRDLVRGALLGAMLLVVPAPAALAQDAGSLADTLSRLERQLQTLERTVYRGDPPPPAAAITTPQSSSSFPPAAAAQLQRRMDQFEDELRSLTGQVERMSFEMRQVATRLDKLVADVDFRLRTLEQGGAPADVANRDQADDLPSQTGGTPPPLPAGVAADPDQPSTVRVIGQLTESQLRAAQETPPAGQAANGGQPAQVAALPTDTSTDAVTLPDGSIAEQYNFARGFLMRRDFNSAELAFRAFIDGNPESDLAGNAQYWLGETYYVRENYLEAARAFAEGYQKFPESGKAPDNLLKLGLALAALERTEDACITLSRLTSEYPDAPANIRQRAERERERLSCS